MNIHNSIDPYDQAVGRHARQLEEIRSEMDMLALHILLENPDADLKKSIPGQIHHNIGNALQVMFTAVARQPAMISKAIDALEQYASNLAEIDGMFEAERQPSSILKSLCGELRNIPA